MIKINQSDKKYLANIYNTDGKEAMYRLLREKYLASNPSQIFSSMKRAAYLAYSLDDDRFLIENQESIEADIFLDIESLCSRKTESVSTISSEPVKHPQKSMETLIQELIGQRLLTLSQYVSLDPTEKVLRVDKTWLQNDGYRVITF